MAAPVVFETGTGDYIYIYIYNLPLAFVCGSLINNSPNLLHRSREHEDVYILLVFLSSASISLCSHLDVT